MNIRNLTVLKSNKHYRVNDLYNQCGPRWEQDRQVILTDPQYRETFLYHYLKNKKHEQDINTFKQAVIQIGDKKMYPKPTDTELVVHLRMGDSMGTDDEFNTTDRVPDLLGKFDEIKNVIENNDEIDKITVVTALHFGDCELEDLHHYTDETYNRNIQFLTKLEQQINSIGHEMNLVSNQDIDKDIYYMIHSKHFIPSISNLTRWIVIPCADQQSIKIYTKSK